MMNHGHEKTISKIKSSIDVIKGNKYSYFCKNCGYVYMSNDKHEVKAAKKNHKVLMEMQGKKALICPFVQKKVTNKDKTHVRLYYARPSVAQALGWKY